MQISKSVHDHARPRPDRHSGDKTGGDSGTVDELEEVNVKERRKVFLVLSQEDSRISKSCSDIPKRRQALVLSKVKKDNDADVTTKNSVSKDKSNCKSVVRALVKKFNDISSQPSSL